MTFLNPLGKYKRRENEIQFTIMSDQNPSSEDVKTGLSFGQAILALNEGKKVAREGWNGKNMFLLMNGGYEVPKDDTRPDNHINQDFLESQGCISLVIQKHIDMWTAQKTLCVGWLASQSDMLAEDWSVID